MAPLDEVKRGGATAGGAMPVDGRGADALHGAAAGSPTFSIGEDEMEIGMGIHGEPGVRRGHARSRPTASPTR